MNAWSIPLMAIGAGSAAVFSSVKDAWERVVSFLIRPERQVYDDGHLGPVRFQRKGVGPVYRRKDFKVENMRGMSLEASMWCPEGGGTRPCVVYIHSSGGSRVEAVDILPEVIELRYSMVALDLSGSGRSEGEHVTLGAFEQQDVCCIVDHLRAHTNTSDIILWGRSMGASTALLYASRDSSIAALILDSPYSSVTKLLTHFCGLMVPWMPGAAIDIGVQSVSNGIKTRAAFDLTQLDIIKSAGNCSQPALFGLAIEDVIIDSSHLEALLGAYKGKQRSLVNFEGDHTSQRGGCWREAVKNFLLRHVGEVPEVPPATPVAAQTPPPLPQAEFEDVLRKIVSGKSNPVEVTQVARMSRPVEGVEIDEVLPSMLLNLSLCCLKLGEFKMGFQYAMAAISLTPQNPKGYYRAGLALLEIGDVDPAGWFAQRCVALGGGTDAKKLLNELCVGGHTSITETETLGVTACYIGAVPQTASTDIKRSPSSWKQLGNSQVKARDYAAAAVSYTQGLLQYAHLAAQLTRKAGASIHTHAPLTAVYDTLVAITLNHRVADAHSRRTQGYLKLNLLHAASVSVELGLALHPSDSGLLNLADEVRTLVGSCA